MIIGRKQNKGFTLIEIMIALVIMGILVSIAYPSYVSYIMKSRRSDALAALAQYQITLERCYAQNFSYNGTCGSLPSFPAKSAQGYYNVTLASGTSTYTLTATPLGTQAQDTTCAKFTVDQSNLRSGFDSSGTSQVSCWNPT